MTIHRFFVEGIENLDNIIVLPEEVSYQISKVLRLKIGDIICVFDKTQTEYTLMLEDLQKIGAKGRVIKKEKNTAEPATEIHLYQALLPREKFEDVLAKGTQIGISAVTPVETERSIVKAKDIHEEKLKRWQKITQEAAEQSERGIVPTVYPSSTFKKSVEEAVIKGEVIIAWEEERDNLPSSVLSNIKKSIISESHKEDLRFKIQDSIIDSGQARVIVSIFIGPEGGFTKEEIAFATEKGVKSMSLGKRILKSETAGLVLAALFLYSVGDLDRR